MKNWSGNLEFHPEIIFSPTSQDEIIEIVRNTSKDKKSIRPIGSMHSWTPLYNTNEYLLNLDSYSGVINKNIDQKKMSFKSGTKVNQVTSILLENNLSLNNQGDIDSQSLAGALNTGTHGTGLSLQSMPNQMSSFSLITASGDVKNISKEFDTDFFNATAIGLGKLGIVSEIQIQAQELYQLKVETESAKLDDVLPILDKLISENRHFELFYFPTGDWAMIKKSNMTSEKPKEKNIITKASNFVNDIILENYLFEFFNNIALRTNKYQTVDQLISKFVGKNTKIDFAQRAFPTKRNVRFMEMEYCVDLNDFHKVLAELRFLFKSSNIRTLFPIEIRFSAADDLWLSPAYKRVAAYFAIHTYIKEDYLPYFQAAQEIFKKYLGRPHWGKWHSLSDGQLSEIYPKYRNFLELQAELDPKGCFKHLKNTQ